MNQSTIQTVIVGGGFTGLFTALYLSQQRYVGRILLVNPSDRFIFRPLLYELVTGQMRNDQVWPSYTELLAGTGVTLVLDSAEQIDLVNHKVELASGRQLDYTHLVLATGSAIDHGGIPGAAEYAFAFRSAEDALALRKHLLSALERGYASADPDERRRLLRVVVVGAGDSGVELAATLGDWLPATYAQLGGRPQETKVVLLGRGPEILSSTVDQLRRSAHEALLSRTVPVELLTGAPVSAMYPGRVEYIHNGEAASLEAGTIVWTGGTAVSPVIRSLAIPAQNRDPAGRPIVTPTLQLLGLPGVFAGGDCATRHKRLPATAQVAYQHAQVIARNLISMSAGETPAVEHVFMRGTLMKLGLEEGAAELFDRFEIQGRLGHIIRQLTYLELIPVAGHAFKVTTEWIGDELVRRARSLV